jgi:AcrR family transcriptional regulator
MGSQERRQREAEATRELILDAARRLFVENGYDATSMRAIAREIEYTPTAIYHHFRGKEELFDELLHRDFHTLGSAFRKIGRVEDSVERIAQAGRAYVEFAASHPMHYQLMFMTMVPPSEAAQGLRSDDRAEAGDLSLDAYAFVRDAVSDAMAAGRFRPEFTDVDTVAQLLWGTLHGLVSLRIAKAHRSDMHFPDLAEAAREARGVLLRGLLRDPDTLPSPLP